MSSPCFSAAARAILFLKHFQDEGRSSLKKWLAVWVTLVLPSAIAESRDFLSTPISYIEDINMDGIKERISVTRDDGASRPYIVLKIMKGNEPIFASQYIEYGDGGFLIKDINSHFAGKEIVACGGDFVWNGQKTAYYYIQWYGWDAFAKRYSLYNYVKTRRQYSRGTKTQCLDGFKVSGESGSLYQKITLTRLFLAAARKEDWAACRKMIGTVYRGEADFSGTLADFLVKEAQKAKGEFKCRYYLPYHDFSYDSSTDGNFSEIRWRKVKSSHYLIHPKYDNDGSSSLLFHVAKEKNEYKIIGLLYCSKS